MHISVANETSVVLEQSSFVSVRTGEAITEEMGESNAYFI